MSVHPGDIIRWQGESHQVVAIRPTYLTLRAVDGDGDDVEVLAADGTVAISDLIFPSPGSTGIAAFADGGTAHLRSLTVSGL